MYSKIGDFGVILSYLLTSKQSLFYDASELISFDFMCPIVAECNLNSMFTCLQEFSHIVNKVIK